MNELKTFENPEFGKVRTVAIGGEPWLVGKDVALALGYTNPKKALIDHVDQEDKMQGDGVTIRDPMGREQHPTIINESGLYALTFSSKLPKAKEFKHWVTSEVLPSIRKHGGYIAGQESMSDEELLSRALLMAQSKIEERDRQIAAMKEKAELDAPKVAFANAVHETKSNITVEKFAKALYDENGLRLGRNKMFALLRSNGYLNEKNIPYQRYIDSGYFTTCEVMKYGRPYIVTLITGKGQLKLFKELFGAEETA